MRSAYEILHVEDSPDDAELVQRALARSGLRFALRRVDNEPDFAAALATAPDVVLCDYEMPLFSAERAMRVLQERHPQAPFIVVSNHIGQSAAVVAMQQGASDYLSKRDLGRLSKAIELAVERADARRAEAQAVAALRASEAMTRGILESLDSRIAVLDGRGVILAVNQAWSQFGGARVSLGLPPGVPGDNYLELLERAAEARPAAREGIASIRRVIAREANFAAMDYEACVDGATRWFLARVLALEGSQDGVVIAHQDITDRMLAHLSLERANHRLQVLSKRVLSIQEEERSSLARELHDDLGQTLAALKIALLRLAAPGAAPDAGLLQECIGVADEAIERTRRMSQDLHPPQLEQLGLADAMSWLAQRQARASGVDVSCRFDELSEKRAPRAVEMACYRIAQEALNNATRHAAPHSIELGLALEGDLLRLTVRDDGSGFDEPAARERALKSGRLGMISMEERAQLAGGRLKVRTAPGRGTLVTATFPVGAAAR